MKWIKSNEFFVTDDEDVYHVVRSNSFYITDDNSYYIERHSKRCWELFTSLVLVDVWHSIGVYPTLRQCKEEAHAYIAQLGCRRAFMERLAREAHNHDYQQAPLPITSIFREEQGCNLPNI